MWNDTRKFDVRTPSGVSTDTVLVTDLVDDHGLPSELLSGASVRIVAKQTSSGAADTIDERIFINDTSLYICEGSNGLTAGDVYTVEVTFGSRSPVTATSQAST